MIDTNRIKKGLWWQRNWELLNGCSEISPACLNCFAREYIKRFQSQQERWQGLLSPDGKRWNGTVKLCEDKLHDPLKKKRPAIWFMTERGDFCHENVPMLFRLQALDVVNRTKDHIFVLLTKRPKILAETLQCYYGCSGLTLPNLYLGITAENQEWLKKRIEDFIQIPGKKFISYEPALGPLSLMPYLFGSQKAGEAQQDDRIHSVIIGAESGHNQRRMEIEWAESAVAQCNAADVPVFVKQLHINGKLDKNLNEWPEHLRRRELLWIGEYAQN